ncbi:MULTISPECIES: PTS sugar transporter subunit IIA [unclassified Acidovorax]|jgi:PTS system ascorbate-specific IIA component|uniref:PTS sugar transporter subunit IIA n=1 Tax=unclassified Acidovorax TaxID=2684926 RepID=UPI000BD03DEF|nr:MULTISPECIES: PTS sugar transporter subunit IIA [unclassified Acidovorax]OZA57281.1 MAG: PTS fructose transporter subunit IIA [Acidovorax sp. 17-64-282]HQS22528.1 PTS sugar transporter subunit IIA [Acidovorax defluvii]OYY26476.1 MAG: PTS fructose transporter subunit IIA [Acidovorax sp. 35-64-16]OYY85371.1 MAG: PTS fructose transporter subunit IIA [Acidovorax sp. 28-64-14]OYZ44785.1 MAG: PTS fructose transporter subunit IIA [Acidovorax sp. 16-64-162]
MSTSILIIAHAPLAHALRECALHVFADCGDSVAALDVQPHAAPEDSLAQARGLLEQMGTHSTLVLTDLFGATPCNIAQRLVDGVGSRLVAGVNLPMLLRAVSYRAEPLDAVVSRAVVGGTQGVMQVAIAAPQNQTRRNSHDQDPHDHQQ